MKVTVIGTGSWGTALAQVLFDSGHRVLLWGRNPEVIEEINQKGTNLAYLNDFQLNPAIKATTDLQAAVQGAEMLLIVVPTKAIRSIATQLQPLLKTIDTEPLIVHATKGLEPGTHYRVSQIIEEVLGAELTRPVTALSGPSHAEEVARQDITMVTAANPDIETAKAVQEAFMNGYFRVYSNTDILGVELGGALKNIIALATGVLAGTGYGDNARAALMTRGLAEITRLGVALGSDPLTFSGLSGVGDLIVTCTSRHSRNYRAGLLLAQGKKRESVDQEVHMIVEGMSTCCVANDLAQQIGIDMPITAGLYDLIYEDADVLTTVKQLMARVGKQEANMTSYEVV